MMGTSRIAVFAPLLLLLLVAAACTPTGGEPSVAQRPEVFVFPGPTEKILISTEDIPQNNCDGSAEKSDTVERSHTVLRTMELGTGLTVDAGGQAGIPGVGQVGVGVAVASHYNVSYGSEDRVTRATRVAAAAGTNILHTIRQYEIWETGEILVSVAGVNERIPYRFRKDFGMETLPPANLGCPGSPSQADESVSTPPVTTGSAHSTEPSQGEHTTEDVQTAPEPVSGESSQDQSQPEPGSTAALLDQLFDNGNWFCFPDRTNGIGVRLLPANFTVVAPLRYIDTFRGRFAVGDVEIGATGATVELATTLPKSQCPSWQRDALDAWVAERSTGSGQITSAAQLNDIFGEGNWSCLADYPFAARVSYLDSALNVAFPFSTVDVYDGTKRGVGEVVESGGEITVWFAGSVPREQCP